VSIAPAVVQLSSFMIAINHRGVMFCHAPATAILPERGLSQSRGDVCPFE
jgi:hypothetical protein